MMKLKHLVVDTECAAREALKNWNYDRDSLIFWRGSSNLIYRFKYQDIGYILRLSHEEENSLDKINSELEYLEYLRERGFPANYSIKSNNNRNIETIYTSLGKYYAVVFNQEQGVQYELEEMSEAQIEAWGKALGGLHSLSKAYKPSQYRPRSWNDVLDECRIILEGLPGQEDAIKELESVSTWLNKLPVTSDNYGLIHYDFESDNMFWHEEIHEFSAIDFDDAMYHWYMMDIVCALKDLIEDENPRFKEMLEIFLKGYCTQKEVDNYMISLIPGFLRFDNLYSYTRLVRSLQDSDFEEDPDWLKRVRPKLVNVCMRLKEGFKNPWHQE